MTHRPLGTILFPPLALAYHAAVWLMWRSATGLPRNALFFGCAVSLPTLLLLAAAGWRSLGRRPVDGVFLSACLLLLFPFTQEASDAEGWKYAFGAASLAGVVGVLYFAALGVAAQVVARRRRQVRARRGSPVERAGAAGIRRG
jgi:hypothetical protein